VWILFEKDLEAAEAILRSLYVPKDLPDWRCACGEACEGQFTQCWRCGAYRES